VLNNTICELTRVRRFSDNALLQDAYKCANGEDIDLGNYKTQEHELWVSRTNQAVDAINRKWNKHCANGRQVEVTGSKQRKSIEHERLKLMAYKSNGNTYYNNEESIVKAFNDKLMWLIKEMTTHKFM
jgi:acyl transferase domain-containing protein